MPAPETIDDDARGQWVLRTGNPPGELQPPALLGGHCWLIEPRNHRQHPARDLLSQSHVIPPEMHLRIRDRILRYPHHPVSWRQVFFQFRNFLCQHLLFFLRSLLITPLLL